MPKYEVIYQSTTVPPYCTSGSSVAVHLVQDSIAKHPNAGSTDEFVDYVNVYYDQNENENFVLTLHDASFNPGDIRATVSEGSEREAATHLSTDSTLTGWEVHFSAPTGWPSTTTFSFGVGSPPEKIKVKIKKQEDPYTCP